MAGPKHKYCETEPGSKMETAIKLLKRPEGATKKQIAEAVGYGDRTSKTQHGMVIAMMQRMEYDHGYSIRRIGVVRVESEKAWHWEKIYKITCRYKWNGDVMEDYMIPT